MLEWLRALFSLASRLATLETKVKEQQNRMDTLETKFLEALAAIDEATNVIAAEIEKLKAQITGQGMPAAKEAEVLDLLTQQVTKLQAIGKPPAPPEGGEGGEGGTGNGS